MNVAGRVLARGAEKLGIKWCPTPLATVWAPRGLLPPCVYRGFCVIGCSTNAKQSALMVWVPRALAAGAEIRDLAMVARIELGPNGLVTGVQYHREGKWRFQRARNVVGLWGRALRDAMSNYIHMAGLKICGEVLPREENRIELADDMDEYGLRIARVVFGYCDNDNRLHRHAVRFMREALAAAGARDI